MGKKHIIHFDTGRKWRGGQNQVYLLIKGLKRYNIKQSLISPQNSPLSKKVKKLNIQTINLDPTNDMDFLSGIKLRRIVKRISPRIIHFHTSKSLGIGALSLGFTRLKKIYTRRVDLPISLNPVNVLKYRLPDKIVVISDFIKRYFNRIGFKKVKKIYSGVDTDKYKFKFNKQIGSSPRVGMMGALDLKHKDYITFIKAARKVLEEKNEVEFWIAGEGKHRERIERFIKKSGLQGKVKMLGFVKDTVRFFDSIDILVHTVNFEGLGTSIAQAMSFGVPVIGTNVGGIPELIEDRKNGYLIEKKDFKMTAQRIVNLLEKEDIRSRFADSGRAKIEKYFSAEKMSRDYFNLYRSLIKEDE
ncbi:MAG: glycosyltransferase family 4 protein [Atribacterota bacterium]